jgi:hypothetical protein
MPSQEKILNGIKGLYAGLGGLAAYLSATLIKERLIPEQLEVIGTVGTFFILVALLLTFVYWPKLSKILTACVIVTIVALCALTFVQIQYVVAANVGQRNESGAIPEYHFLIGYQLTEYGKNRGATLGENKSEKQYIETGGYDLIPLWYGTSFKIMAVAYTLFYMLFVVGVVLMMGGILQRGGNAASKMPSLHSRIITVGNDSCASNYPARH